MKGLRSTETQCGLHLQRVVAVYLYLRRWVQLSYFSVGGGYCCATGLGGLAVVVVARERVPHIHLRRHVFNAGHGQDGNASIHNWHREEGVPAL